MRDERTRVRESQRHPPPTKGNNDMNTDTPDRNTNDMNHNSNRTAMKNSSTKILLSILLPVFALCALPSLTGCALPVPTGPLHPDASAEPALSPIDELRFETGRAEDDARRCTTVAMRYHDQGEFSLAYRIYAWCVENGRIERRDFFRVLRDDARSLAASYPEKRMTVLRDDGAKNPADWPVVRIRPEDKAAVWKDKGVTPKNDWLAPKEWSRLLKDVSGMEMEVSYERPGLTLEECRRTLERYDLLRAHAQRLLDGTEDALVRDAPGDAALESLRGDLMALKKEVRIARTRVVSYTLVSPFLAETVRLRRIAGDNFFQMLFNHRANAGKRLDAISMLALACHNEILMSCTEDVRIQFCDVVSGLKRISRPAEWDHFKTVTTMLDSYDPSKKRGADAWWE